MEKGENGGFQHFLPFPVLLKRLFFQAHENLGLFWKGLTLLNDKILE